MEDDQYAYNDAPQTLSDIFFSFDGRINRAKYWGYSIVLVLGMIVICGLGMFFAGEMGLWSSYAIALLFVVWPSLALGVKRCHDRNRSGWFMIVSLIPIVSIWYLVEIGFLRGTDGPNDYGEDPLG